LTGCNFEETAASVVQGESPIRCRVDLEHDGVYCESVVEDVAIKSVVINRGNCLVKESHEEVEEYDQNLTEELRRLTAQYSGNDANVITRKIEGVKEEWRRTHTRVVKHFPHPLKFGEWYVVQTTRPNCNIIEFSVETDRGTWTWGRQ
jgi:hypothetical protein